MGVFSDVDAWWLAELSRLVYRLDCNDILTSVGLREIRVFERNAARGMLVVHETGPGEPTAVVVFRGTHDIRNWLANLNTLPIDWPSGGRVHTGFVEVLDRIWPDIEPFLETWSGRVVYTGHSLGAALATLAAGRRTPSVVYSFGSPRVGDAAFVVSLGGVPIYRVVNNRDIVTTVPMSVGPLEFVHAGELVHMRHQGVDAPDADEVCLKDPATYRRWYDPPQPLADHAPVNYVAHVRATSWP